MADIFFFTDKDTWLNQTDQKPFGAIDDNKYRICSRHKFGATPNLAFAPEKSIVLVQNAIDNNGQPIDGVVNVLFKPLRKIAWEYETISYIVYKGIKKDSLIDANGKIVNQNVGYPDLRVSLYEQQGIINEQLNISEVPDSSHIGYDFSSTVASDDQNYVPDDFYIEDLIELDDSDLDLQLPIVDKGMFIGKFRSDDYCDFEIIGERVGYEYTLREFRTIDRVVDVSGYQGFEQKHRREEILHYFDTAAFFGNFYKNNLRISLVTSSGGALNVEVIPDFSLQEKFVNKNKIYLDIRHKTGYSYNYYNEFNYSEGPTSIDFNILYKTIDAGYWYPLRYDKNWPIFTPDLYAVENLDPSGDVANLHFSLRLNFGNLTHALESMYPVSSIESNTPTKIGKKSLLLWSKSFLEGGVSGSLLYDKLSLREIIIDPSTPGEDRMVTLKVRLKDANNNIDSVIGGYYNVKSKILYQPNNHEVGLVPRRLDATGASEFQDALIRYDRHNLDLMFPVFEMKPIFKPKTNRVTVRLYSSQNAFLTEGAFGSQYSQLYLPKIGMAIDNNNYTFFSYIEQRNIIDSAKERSGILAEIESNFTINEADFIFSLTKQDLNVTVKKRGPFKYQKIVGETGLEEINSFYFVKNNSIDQFNNELDIEHFDSITLTKDQFEALKTLKEQEFGDKYRVYLGLSTLGKIDVSGGGKIRRVKIFLKGLEEDSAGKVKEKHVKTDISLYAFYQIPRVLNVSKKIK